MVGINKWTDGQVALVFSLRAQGMSKYDIAKEVNAKWPRRGATSAGVNYVLNTKKHQLSKTPSKAQQIKSPARAAATLQSLSLLPETYATKVPNARATQIREISGRPMLATLSEPTPINILNCPFENSQVQDGLQEFYRKQLDEVYRKFHMPPPEFWTMGKEKQPEMETQIEKVEKSSEERTAAEVIEIEDDADSLHGLEVEEKNGQSTYYDLELEYLNRWN